MGEFNLNMLLLLGIILFLGTAGGELLDRVRVPRVAAYILVGLLIGGAGFGVVCENTVRVLQPLNYFAIGLVGFFIGGELKRDIFMKWGKSLLTIFCFKGFSTFLIVSSLVSAAGFIVLGESGTAIALGLLLGAIATAADPASQSQLITETRSRGPLTSNILGMIGLSDAFAIVLFGFASSVAARFIGHGAHASFAEPFFEVAGSVIAGSAAGVVISFILDRYGYKEGLAGITFGLLLLVLGVSIAAGLDLILAAMSFGVVLANLRPEKSNHIFRLAGMAVPPVFVLFFVLIGASVDPGNFNRGFAALAAIYVAGAAGGKILGIRLGAVVSGAPSSVVKYLPYCLFAQAGVAVGLTILAVQNFPEELGNILIAVIAPSVLVLQIAGPVLTKFSLSKAGETGLNLTEEDLLEAVKARELAGESPRVIYEDTTLSEILKLFSSGENLIFPVVSDENRLLGVVSVDGIKSAMMEFELGSMLIALDIMEPAPDAVHEDAPLSGVMRIMDRYEIDFVPVAGDSGLFKGIIDRRMLKKFVSRTLAGMQKRIDSLEKRSPRRKKD